MVFTDAKAPDNPIIFANDSFLKLTGYSREEVLGQSFNFLIARGVDPDALAAIEAMFHEHTGNDPEIRYRRKDDSIFWAAVFVTPVRDKAGNVIQHFASFMDTTRHRKEQDRLHFLLDELNHRTQNTLATVLAIAKQTFGGVVDDQILNVYQGRILALSKAQALLGRLNWDRVGLHHIIERILEPFGLRDLRVDRFEVQGDESKNLKNCGCPRLSRQGHVALRTFA